MKIRTVFFLLVFVFSPVSAAEGTWWKGNTHTHSTLSDGDSAPADVAARYLDLGYDFLVLTDHNYVSGFRQYSTPDFLCINGEEITASDRRHINALGINRTVFPGTIQSMVDITNILGGQAHFNHPTWSGLGAADIYPVEGLKFMEINASNDERIWDQVLSMGKRIYGVASDDCHSLYSQSGKRWIMVRAPNLTQTEIFEAMDSGEFYSSNGAILNDYVVLPGHMIVDSQDGKLIEFIGFDGEVLKSVSRPYAVYTFKGSETYVRARITNALNQHAWTQPVFEPGLSSDFDQDGDIDGSDFLAWQTGCSLNTGATHSDGDADGDGDVDNDDLLMWQYWFGKTAGNGSLMSAVPEPSSVTLLFTLNILLLALLHCRMSRRFGEWESGFHDTP